MDQAAPNRGCGIGGRHELDPADAVWLREKLVLLFLSRGK